MKKTLLIVILVCFSFGGCSKDGEDQKTITNLSGEVWYDTCIYFSDGADAGSELTGFEQKGTIEIGESCVVSTSAEYFNVSFDNAEGDMTTSKNIRFSGNSATVRASDLY